MGQPFWSHYIGNSPSESVVALLGTAARFVECMPIERKQFQQLWSSSSAGTYEPTICVCVSMTKHIFHSRSRRSYTYNTWLNVCVCAITRMKCVMIRFTCSVENTFREENYIAHYSHIIFNRADATNRDVTNGKWRNALIEVTVMFIVLVHVSRKTTACHQQNQRNVNEKKKQRSKCV